MAVNKLVSTYILSGKISSGCDFGWT